MSLPIIRAKLRPPVLPADHVPRSHLLERLQAGRGKKLTLVIAGAGYGKTTLLAEWVKKNECALWYSLDGVDRDPAVFFAYLIAGLRERWLEFGRGMEASLNRPILDPERLTLTLIGEFENSLESQPLLIVFDDYHRLEETPAVDTIMALLLERLPPSVHIVISSRVPVKFPTARLRAAGHLNELTSFDLRFSAEEISRLFHALDTLPDVVQQFVDRTEGWIAGLQLIRQALAQRGHLDPAIIFKDSSGPPDQIYRFLAEEVFERQPASLQEFLLQTGILETFSPADGDAIFGRTDSAGWLTYLVNQGLFTIHLQREPDVYRYHHLLAGYLHDKVRNLAEARAWHRQAAVYYDEHQRWDEAFEHAMSAEDESLATDIVLQATRTMRLSGRLDTVQGWLDRLAPRMYTLHPQLYCQQGNVWEDQGRHGQALGAFRQALALAELHDDRSTLLNAWYGLGIVFQRTGDLDGARQAFQKALAYATSGAPLERFTVLNGLATVYFYSGQHQQAVALYHQCLEIAGLLGRSQQALIMSNLCAALTRMGEFSEALQWGESALQLRQEGGEVSGIVSCLTNVSYVRALAGQITAARSDLDKAIALGGKGPHPSVLAYIFSNRGDLAALDGDFVTAEELYRRSIELKEPLQDVSGLVHTWTRLSELRRRQGDLAEATRCAERALQLSEGAVGLYERLLTQMALALTWRAQGRDEQAGELFSRIAEAHRNTTDNHYELVRALWYLASTQHALGQSSHVALAEALALAERWNYRFQVTALAREQPDLLIEAVAADLEPSFVSDVLIALGGAIVPALAKLLDSNDPILRIRAIERLELLGTESVWRPIYRAIRDRNTQVRQTAHRALSRLHHSSPAPVCVTTLGHFTLRRGEQPVPDEAWVNRKAQALFKHLLAESGQPVQRDVLREMLWPQASPEAARRNLNQAAFTLRRVLEPYLPPRYPSRYLISEGETYRLELPSGSWMDDRAFEEAVKQAQEAQLVGDLETALACYQTAADLYQGDYLVEDTYEDWPFIRRESLRKKAVLTLAAQGKLSLDRNEAVRAVQAAERLLSLDPLNEEGYHLLMRAHLALGQREAALRVYLQCQERLESELEVAPSNHIRTLYQQIRAQN